MYFKHWLFAIIVFLLVFIVTFFNRQIIDIDGVLNEKNVKEIIKYIDNDYNDIKINNDELNLKPKFTNDFMAKTFERDAAIFMRLIDNLNVVRFEYNGLIYKYYYDDLNTLFDYKIKEKALVDITNYYKYLKNDYVYIGNIKGIYSLYSKEKTCSDDNYLSSDSMFKYYIICYKKEDLVVMDSKFNTYDIDYLLDRKLVTLSDLMFYNLHMDKELIK
jgi:hypothetical protein